MSVSDCGPVLPLPTHATVNSDKDVAFRGSVIYGCEAGYRLEGTARRVCGTEGQWDTPAPTCVGEFILAEMAHFMFILQKSHQASLVGSVIYLILLTCPTNNEKFSDSVLKIINVIFM